jgi:DNA-binding NtrC family response regulator
MPYTVLVVDDNIDTQENIKELLQENDYKTFGANNGKSALDIIHRHKPDCLLLDMNLPVMSGWEVLDLIKPEIDAGLVVIIITAYGEIPLAVDAIKKGAFDFFDKPFNNEKLLLSIKHGLEKLQIQKELEELKTTLPSRIVSPDDFGPSKAILEMLQNADKVAPTDYSVLIQGPTGSGKNLLAKYIHQKSQRSQFPLINVDCGTISDTLIESELFGHIKGSFTGAIDTKVGKFRAAQKGSLVLDEIGNIPLNKQVKFLRAVEEKKISPIGSNEEFKLDFRLMVATLEDLEAAVNLGKFRRDLFYRITEFVITVPPLTQRLDDIPHLARKFIQRCNLNLNKEVSEISDNAMNMLLEHHWHGNVRELQHVISTAVLMAKDKITPEHISFRGATINQNLALNDFYIGYRPGTPLKSDMNAIIENIEHKYIKKALELANYNKSKAAEIFGIDRKSFYSRLSKYGLKVKKG